MEQTIDADDWMTAMNLSEFDDEDHTALEVEPYNVTVTHRPQYRDELAQIYKACYLLSRICLQLGIPGNILSVIIWLRRQIVSKNSSAVFLTALAINDLVYLLVYTLTIVPITGNIIVRIRWLFTGIEAQGVAAVFTESLLVLGFSVERLIAISCPLQVRFIRYV